MEEKKLTDGEVVAKNAITDEEVIRLLEIFANDNEPDGVDRLAKMSLDLINRKNAEIERLTEELKNLDWYKMWHKKFKKEIDDLTLELETYRPTKLSGNGQCKCSTCGGVSWTDWFSRYKGKTLCDRCLKEIISTEEKQAVKDTVREILSMFDDRNYITENELKKAIAERYGVEVE